MCIFTKKEYKEVHFPFVLITNLQKYEESEESGIFVGFKVLVDSLAREYGDNRFLELECVRQGWDRISLTEA